MVNRQGEHVVGLMLMGLEDKCWIRFLLPMFCKIDTKKAYEHFNWDCLIYFLRRMRFDERWVMQPRKNNLLLLH
jgi:hypothetical protein